MGPLILLAMAISLASTRTVREFRNSHGVVRVTIIPDNSPQGGSAVSESIPVSARGSASDTGSAAATSALPATELAALPDLGIRGDALLDIYFLDKDDGRELRFPATYAQLSAFEQGHPVAAPSASLDTASSSAFASADDQAVAFIRDFSRELRIHMKTPGLSGGKP